MPDSVRVAIHASEASSLQQRLTTRFPSVQTVPCDSNAALAEALKKTQPNAVYSVRFDGHEFPRDALFAEGGPRWIANGGVGVDHLSPWDPSRVTVTNAAGVAADMMAEYALGGFLHFTLDIPGLQTDKAGRIWDATRLVRPLKGQTLLIIGLGHTGQSLATRAKAFGMRVIGTRARPREMEDIDQVAAPSELPNLLPQADFIAVCTPLTKHTRSMIGADQIALMKPGVILADVSRGGVVDQTTLAKALATGVIGGAALDVFEVEPLPETSPLWGLDNVILSPHCSAVHSGWEVASFNIFLDNLDRWLKGEALVNVVDPALGY